MVKAPAGSCRWRLSGPATKSTSPRSLMTAEGAAYSSSTVRSNAAPSLSCWVGARRSIMPCGLGEAPEARAALRLARGNSTTGRVTVSLRRKMRFRLSVGSNSSGLPEMPSDGPRNRKPPGRSA